MTDSVIKGFVRFTGTLVALFGVILFYLGSSWCSMLANRSWNPISAMSRVRWVYSLVFFFLFRWLPEQTESAADMDYHVWLYSFCFRRAHNRQWMADSMLTIWRIECAKSGRIFSYWLAFHPMGWRRTFLLIGFSCWSSIGKYDQKQYKISKHINKPYWIEKNSRQKVN